MPAANTRRLNVKKVAIVGAGPSGIAAAKYLTAEGAFDTIDVFEQRARVGGVWDYHNEQKPAPRDLQTPQLSPHAGGLARPIWDLAAKAEHTQAQAQTHAENGENGVRQGDARFLSALYDRLETNIPRGLMGFSDLDWPESAQLFPKHETVTRYIEDYARDVEHLVKFHTQVVDVSLAAADEGVQDQWVIKTQKIQPDGQGSVETGVYDAVVVANGHFCVPFVPDIEGMKEWAAMYPGAITHSLYYQKPEDYEGKKVVIVGNGPSGMDLAVQIMDYCAKPLLHSTRSESMLIAAVSENKKDVQGISEFVAKDRTIRFVDGTVEKDIDYVLFCTGYFYSFPFIKSLDPPLIEDGFRVQNVYQHMLYRARPTLAFPVLQQRVIPFPMAEAQSAVIARLWSGRLPLPTEDEMDKWEEKVKQETGGGRSFHLLPFPKDADYINAMYDWAMSADDAQSTGKRPPRWGEKQRWMRERFPAIKKAFQDRGEGRHSVRTIEELGFNFEEYKEQRLKEDKSLV